MICLPPSLGSCAADALIKFILGSWVYRWDDGDVQLCSLTETHGLRADHSKSCQGSGLRRHVEIENDYIQTGSFEMISACNVDMTRSCSLTVQGNAKREH